MAAFYIQFAWLILIKCKDQLIGSLVSNFFRRKVASLPFKIFFKSWALSVLLFSHNPLKCTSSLFSTKQMLFVFCSPPPPQFSHVVFAGLCLNVLIWNHFWLFSVSFELKHTTSWQQEFPHKTAISGLLVPGCSDNKQVREQQRLGVIFLLLRDAVASPCRASMLPPLLCSFWVRSLMRLY